MSGEYSIPFLKFLRAYKYILRVRAVHNHKIKHSDYALCTLFERHKDIMPDITPYFMKGFRQIGYFACDRPELSYLDGVIWDILNDAQLFWYLERDLVKNLDEYEAEINSWEERYNINLLEEQYD